MFDSIQPTDVSRPFASPPVLQFVSIEIMPTGDSGLAVSIGGTFLDEESVQLVSGDISASRVATLEAAIAVIREGLERAFADGAAKKGH